MEMQVVHDDNGNYQILNGQILCRNQQNGQNEYVILTQEICRQLNISETYVLCNREIPTEPPKTKWTTAATRSLLIVYKEKKHLFDSHLKNEEIWEIIGNEMATNLYIFTPAQIKNKFVNLKRAYTKRKDNIKQTGSAATRFDYWDEFEEMFAHHHNVSPPVTASNMNPMILQIQQSPQIEEPEIEEVENIAGPSGTQQLSRKRPSIQKELLDEFKLSRADKKERWEEKKKIMLESRDLFKDLMTKIIEKL